jgi:hypothetical protein
MKCIAISIVLVEWIKLNKNKVLLYKLLDHSPNNIAYTFFKEQRWILIKHKDKIMLKEHDGQYLWH